MKNRAKLVSESLNEFRDTLSELSNGRGELDRLNQIAGDTWNQIVNISDPNTLSSIENEAIDLDFVNMEGDPEIGPGTLRSQFAPLTARDLTGENLEVQMLPGEDYMEELDYYYGIGGEESESTDDMYGYGIYEDPYSEGVKRGIEAHKEFIQWSKKYLNGENRMHEFAHGTIDLKWGS